MSDMNERSDAMRGSLPVALADYKQLAKDCGVDEGIDLPVVAMAFVHGAAYGAKHPTLTDEERKAMERLCEAVTQYAADDRKINGETFAAGDERAVAIVRGWLARLT